MFDPEMPFRRLSFATVVPLRRAMAPSVSPFRMVTVRAELRERLLRLLLYLLLEAV